MDMGISIRIGIAIPELPSSRFFSTSCYCPLSTRKLHLQSKFMNPMDVKGLTWVGNVYQKFEAMCLEVEEIMYQDTLKYVENQVETVGASFKRFYSDVIEDLVPPSTDEFKKAGDSDTPALNYNDTDRYRKLKTGIRHAPSRLAVEEDSDNSKVVTDVDANVCQASNLHRHHKVNNLSANSSGDLAKGATSNIMFSRQKTDDCFHLKSNLGLKGKLQKDSQGERSGAMPPPKKNSSTLSSLSKFYNDIHKASDCRMDVSPNPAFIEVASSDSFQEKRVETEKADDQVSDILAESSSSDVFDTVKGSVEKEKDVRFVHNNMPETSTAKGKCATNTVASCVYILGDGDALCRLSSEEAFESSAGRPDDQHIDAEASYMTITDQVMEAIQHDAQINFEECVVVDENELPFVPFKDGKHRVHKGGIRKILSSRKNSARKQEYELLAMWHGNGGVLSDSARVNPAVSRKEIKSPPIHEVCESEWELI